MFVNKINVRKIPTKVQKKTGKSAFTGCFFTCIGKFYYLCKVKIAKKDIGYDRRKNTGC